MKTGSSFRSSIYFGLWWGIRLACIYAGILGLQWILSEKAELTIGQRVFGFLWFWLYGCIVGSVLGGIGGAVSGHILYKVLMRLKSNIHVPAWVVGVAICTIIWLIVHVTIGRLLLSEGGSRQLYPIFIGYPGIIYIVAGGALSHYWHRQYIH